MPKERDVVDALMETSRVMTAIVARTLADVPENVTVPQLRVLVVIDSRGAINVGTVAEVLGVNPSNATRTCDKLVEAGLVARTTDPDDRRRGILQLTAHGQELVADLMQARRAVLEELAAKLSSGDREALDRALGAFLAVVDRAPDDVVMGETRGSIIPWLR